MRSKSILLLALALGCGLVASIGISQIIEGRNKAPSADSDVQPIFVAMTDINANEVLSAQVIKLEEWPKKMVPAGALTKLENVEGKRARTKLYQGEPIVAAKLLGANESVGAANQIPAGYRVAHVKVDAVTGGNNLILPGDRVDVLVFRNTGDMNATAAKIVLQDIKVFAVDTHTETEFTRTKGDQSEPMTAKTIALLVTPQQSVILHAASEISGSVRLALRNPEDESHANIPGATIGDIFGPDQFSNRSAEQSFQRDANRGPKKDVLVQPPVAERIGAPWKMVVMYGSELMEVEFPADGRLPNNLIKKDALRPANLPAAPIPGSQLTRESEEDATPPENEEPQSE
ncbi:MAG: Flp pilus assembly protein CpaB [Planctomycetia bacterium]|nr:Flp pilus assembly protein CpaB [Planctomycetia bacterium]